MRTCVCGSWSSRMRAKLTLIAGIFAGMAVLAACFGGAFWLLAPERFPIKELRVKGELRQTTVAAIEAAVPRTTGNFFAADLAQVRAGVEKLPWVRRVAARRVWPSAIELTVEEHVALARWGIGDEMRGLVNTYGETFSGKTRDALPGFVAPAGTAAEVTRRYRRFSQIVAPLGTSIERVVLSPRHAWQLRLANGQHLMLGRDADAAEIRLQNFVAAYGNARIGGKPGYVDLRYPNGFAVRTPDGSG